MAVATIAGSGDNIVSTSFLYGGTYNQFKGKWIFPNSECLEWHLPSIVLFKKFGIGVKFVQGDNPEDFAAAIDDRTKVILTWIRLNSCLCRIIGPLCRKHWQPEVQRSTNPRNCQGAVALMLGLWSRLSGLTSGRSHIMLAYRLLLTTRLALEDT